MLDRRALRFHAICLVTAVWAAFVWTQATGSGTFDRFHKLRGMDFVQFYAAGAVVADGRGDELYDWDRFGAELSTLVPGLGDVRYLPIYPPQTALVFVPFSKLPYLGALAFWCVVSATLYLAALSVLWSSLPALRTYRTEALALALGFPAFVQVIAHGQIGTLGVPLLVLAWFGVRDGRPLVVGVALGSLFFKPQLGTLALAALLLIPSLRLLAGLVIGAGLQILVAGVVYGWSIWLEYYDVIATVTTHIGSFEPKLWAMHSLRGVVLLLAGHSPVTTGIWIALVVVAGVLARRASASGAAPEITFVAICLLGLLANPHLYVYDLVLLAVPLAVLASWLASRPEVAAGPTAPLAYVLVWLPLIGPLSAITHVQLTAPAMMGLLWALGRTPRPLVRTLAGASS
jgi:hypothetical protein